MTPLVRYVVNNTLVGQGLITIGLIQNVFLKNELEKCLSIKKIKANAMNTCLMLEILKISMQNLKFDEEKNQSSLLISPFYYRLFCVAIC